MNEMLGLYVLSLPFEYLTLYLHFLFSKVLTLYVVVVGEEKRTEQNRHNQPS